MKFPQNRARIINFFTKNLSHFPENNIAKGFSSQNFNPMSSMLAKKNSVPTRYYSTSSQHKDLDQPSTVKTKDYSKIVKSVIESVMESVIDFSNVIKSLRSLVRFLVMSSSKEANSSPEFLESVKKIDLNKQEDETGLTMLHYAIMLNMTAWVEILLKHGARSDIEDEKGLLPSDYCISPISEEMKEIFDKYDVKKSKTLNEVKESTPLKSQDIGKKLIGAIVLDKKEVFEQIINDRKIKINFEEIRTGKLSLSLLHLAVCYNRPDMVKSLLSHPDIDSEIKDSLGLNPLEFAQKFGEEKREVIEILAEVRKDKTSPIHILPVFPSSCPAYAPNKTQENKILSK